MPHAVLQDSGQKLKQSDTQMHNGSAAPFHVFFSEDRKVPTALLHLANSILFALETKLLLKNTKINASPFLLILIKPPNIIGIFHQSNEIPLSYHSNGNKRLAKKGFFSVDISRKC